MSEETPAVVEVNPDVAVSKTKAFYRRHKPKLVAAALTAGAATCFVLGRKSKDVVESVDVDVNYTDDNTPQD